MMKARVVLPTAPVMRFIRKILNVMQLIQKFISIYEDYLTIPIKSNIMRFDQR